MDTNANKQTVRRVFEEGFTAGHLDVVDECLAPGAVDRHEFTDEEGDFRGHLKAIITMFRASFPDLPMSVDDLVAEGDRVAARVIAHRHAHRRAVPRHRPERQPGERRAVPHRAVQRRRPRCRPLGRGRRRRPHAPARRHHRAQPELRPAPRKLTAGARAALGWARQGIGVRTPPRSAHGTPPAPPARGRRRRPRSRVGVEHGSLALVRAAYGQRAFAASARHRPLDARAPPAGAEVPRRRRRRGGRGRLRQQQQLRLEGREHDLVDRGRFVVVDDDVDRERIEHDADPRRDGRAVSRATAPTVRTC